MYVSVKSRTMDITTDLEKELGKRFLMLFRCYASKNE